MTNTWYDHPQYYDLLTRDETRREAAFIVAASKRYGGVRSRRLLEPGCGSGRLVVALAARGYQVTGFDVNHKALNYVRTKLKRRRLKADVRHAEMADFTFPRPFDGAYCTLNTFRHLLTEDDARRHLQCVAQCLRPGGIYILGFHLLPLDVADEAEERWRAQHGKTRLHLTLRVTHFYRRQRRERLFLNLRVQNGARVLRLRDDFWLRLYTARQFRQLLAGVPALELVEVFDFDYDLSAPRRFDDELVDAVFVLRRR